MKYNIIVSINNHNIIGENDKLLIHSKKDLKNFYKITTNNYPEGNTNIMIMGYKTWISIPKDKRPLKNRMNIILTKNHKIIESENIKSFNSLENALDWSSNNLTGKISQVFFSFNCFTDEPSTQIVF